MKIKKIIFTFLLMFIFSAVKASDYSNISYGIVNFKTKSCGTNTSYNEYSTNRVGYTNGCYGADGAFLGMENGKVKFMLSGVVGVVNSDEVTVVDIPKYDDSTYISSYIVKEGVLRHCISLDTTHSSYSCVPLGPNTPNLIENVYYLSYDGHYFYQYNVANFKRMIDDYKKGVRTNAYNKTPYYNYYQFITHRSKTNQTASDLNNHVKTMTSNASSKMYNLGSAFINNQNLYGSNGAIMYGTAGNESAWGTSNYALSRNNLFGHNAYDSDPNQAGNYDSPATNVKVHAKVFISEGFMDPCDWKDTKGNGYSSSLCLTGRYNGGQLGNKASGINVRYASDPYWGEKAASNYYNLESKVGYSDYGYYTLGIKTKYGIYNVRKEPNTNSTILYQTIPSNDYPFVILGKVVGNDNKIWYKIQTDPTLDSSRSKLIQDQGQYNYNNNYGYVSSDAVDVYIAGTKKIEDNTNTTYSITFDADGGVFSDKSHQKTINVKKDTYPSIETPVKTGYKFKEWSPIVTHAVKNTTYKAVWEANEYDITFDADGGVFSDNTTSKVVKTKYNELPIAPEPTRDNYSFKAWEPVISKAVKNTTYKATWTKKEEPDDTGFIKRDGEFYLNGFDWNQEKKAYIISGYQIILNSSNGLNDDLNYKIIAIDKNTNEEHEFEIDRWIDDVPFALGSENGYDYNGAWFKGEVSFANLENGDYELYMQADNKNYYSKSIISNLFNKNIKRRGEDDNKGYSLLVDLKSKNQKIILSVRDELITTSEAPTYRNMINNYDNIYFDDDNKLHLIGTSYNYGGDYSDNKNIERKLILENTKDFTRYEFELNSTKNGSYKVTSTDKLSKDYAWYNYSIDVSNLPKGNYSMIVYTKTKDVADYGEINDIFASINVAKASIDEKIYQVKLNEGRNNRIELSVTE